MFSRKIGLSDFGSTRKKAVEEGSLLRASLSEGLIPNMESSFPGLANIEVSHNHTSSCRVQWPMRSDKPESLSRRRVRV